MCARLSFRNRNYGARALIVVAIVGNPDIHIYRRADNAAEQLGGRYVIITGLHVCHAAAMRERGLYVNNYTFRSINPFTRLLSHLIITNRRINLHISTRENKLHNTIIPTLYTYTHSCVIACSRCTRRLSSRCTVRARAMITRQSRAVCAHINVARAFVNFLFPI